MSRCFWPVGEAAQADYETLREAVLSGQPLQSLTAARFGRRGLAGLIAWPVAEPVYTAVMVGAERARWCHIRIRALMLWLPATSCFCELLLIAQLPERTRRCG